MAQLSTRARRHGVLVIGEVPARTAALARGLTLHGFRVVVAGGVEAGLQLATQGACDLVLLELRDPSVLERIHAAKPRLAVIIMAESTTAEARIRTLDAGASDVVTRPVAMLELAARIRAQLRLRERTTATRLRGAGLELDLLTHEVWCNSQPVRLSTTEFRLLAYLLQAGGAVRSRAEILHGVWGGPRDAAASNIVDVYVGYLRRKLRCGDHEFPIVSLRSRGYCLVQ